ncbi:MAG: hypothetical protein ACLU3I_00070 [Acutalibacteraceae bacterium]
MEPSVMVTERNWSAMLEMQDRLFRQQMQLDTDLKTLLTKQEAQEALTAMQASAAEFAETGWEPEREVFFRLQRADREYAESRDFDFGEQHTGTLSFGRKRRRRKSTSAHGSRLRQ